MSATQATHRPTDPFFGKGINKQQDTLKALIWADTACERRKNFKLNKWNLKAKQGCGPGSATDESRLHNRIVYIYLIVRAHSIH